MILRWLKKAIVVAPVAPSIHYHDEFRGQVPDLLWYKGTRSCIKKFDRNANKNC